MKQRGFIQILVLILIVAAVGLGAFYLGRTTKQLPSGETTAATEAPTENETANWKTYTSSKYKYSIKYPPENTGMFENENDFHIALTGPTNDFPFPWHAQVAVQILKNPKNLLLRQLGNNTFATDAPEPYDLGWEEVSFNGYPAIKVLYTPPGDLGPQTIFISEAKGSIYAAWKAVPDEDYGQLADQILSTFKFTE